MTKRPIAEITRVKAAIIREPGYPIGRPAPCYLMCDCGRKVVTHASGTVCNCGRRFDHRGYLLGGGVARIETPADGTLEEWRCSRCGALGALPELHAKESTHREFTMVRNYQGLPVGHRVPLIVVEG